MNYNFCFAGWATTFSLSQDIRVWKKETKNMFTLDIRQQYKEWCVSMIACHQLYSSTNSFVLYINTHCPRCWLSVLYFSTKLMAGRSFGRAFFCCSLYSLHYECQGRLIYHSWFSYHWHYVDLISFHFAYEVRVFFSTTPSFLRFWPLGIYLHQQNPSNERNL